MDGLGNQSHDVICIIIDLEIFIKERGFSKVHGHVEHYLRRGHEKNSPQRLIFFYAP